MRETGCGTGDGAVLPSPSSPTVLGPQHSTPPLLSKAHVFSFPAAILAISGPRACLVPSLNVPVAVKVCFCPTAIELAAGVTAMLSNLGVAAMAPSVISATHRTSTALAGRVHVKRLT